MTAQFPKWLDRPITFSNAIQREFTKGLLVALILTLVPITAFSAEKITPGSTCKVYKQRVTNQNKVYTCIKSGKKLVWNKSLAVVKPTTSPTQTPTPSSIQIPTQAELPAKAINAHKHPAKIPHPKLIHLSK